MLKIKGKYNEAIVYADIIDDSTKEQIQTLLNQSFVSGVQIRIMPDCHAGAGCVIGTTMTIKDKIVPNLVGVDIGCGMLCIKLGKIDVDLPSLDNFIHENIPAGMTVNDDITPIDIRIEDLKCFNALSNITYLKQSIGSLGGGNHFIEIDEASDKTKYLIIHSGSRNLGKQVAEIYQDIAIKYHQNKLFDKKAASIKAIDELKKSGRQREIQKTLEAINNKVVKLEMPKDLCYLEGKDFSNYIFDMDLCQKFALENRKEIARRILKFLNLENDNLELFETIHNYINMEDMIMRKGSIAAYLGERVLIPINMKDGCILGKGKSNPEYNYSAPHGAGRLLSRNEAIKKLSMSEYKKIMKGIYSTTVNKNTIDEAPMAYKPIEVILNNIKDTVEIEEVIKPIYNFKASE